MKTDKISKHNLGPRILHLLTQEGKNSVEIARILTEEGFKISQPTVSRWLSRERESHRDEVRDIVHEHVTKVVPDDMAALEEMERQCLTWSREGPDTAAERISAWKKIKDSYDHIKRDLLSATPDNLAEVMDGFYKQCLNWILEDLENQKQRLSAMREARSIIDTKLKYAGILEGQAGGNIFIGPAKDNDPPPEDEDQDRTLHIAGNQDG